MLFKKEEGMILVVILIFLTLILLLVVISIEMSALEKRMSVNQLRYHQNFQVALAGLKQGEYSLMSGSSACEIPLTSTSDLLSKSNDWWNSSTTCHGTFSGKQYQYVIERLDEDPCASWDENIGVIYYRITSHADNAGLLQMTMAVPSQLSTTCVDQMRQLGDARQSWYSLST